MKNRILCVCVLSGLLSAFVYADDYLAESQTNRATEGMFDEEQDMYLDVIDFSEITKNLLFLSMGSPGEGAQNDFELGIAKLMESLYIGARLDIDSIGYDGNLTGDVSTEQTSDINYYYDPVTHALTGVERTVNERIDYSNQNAYGADVLIGLGKMGIGVSAYQINTSRIATINATVPGTPATPSWITITSMTDTDASTNSSTVTIEDEVGTVLYENVTEYDEGYRNANEIGVDLRFGMPMQIAGMSAEFRAGLGVALVNNNDFSGDTVYVLEHDNDDLAAYEGLADVASYTRETETYSDEYLGLTPSVSLGIERPSNMLGGSTMEIGLEIGLGMPIYFGDPGYSYTYRSYTDQTNGNGNPAYQETVTKGDETRSLSTLNNTLTPSFGLKKDFSDRVKLHMEYSPSVSYNMSTEEVSGSVVQTVTTLDASGLPEDNSVVVTTVTRNNETTENSALVIDHEFTAGAQFMLTEKLRVNIGARAYTTNSFTLNSSTTSDSLTERKVETYEGVTDTAGVDPVLTAYDRSDNSDAPAQEQAYTPMDFSTIYRAGLTYLFSEDFKIDMYAATTGSIWNFSTWTVEFTYSY